MAWTNRAAVIFRDFFSPLNPLSGVYQPPKSDLRTWGTEVEDKIDSLDPDAIADSVEAAQAAVLAAQEAAATAQANAVGGGVAYDTLALLNADLAHPANTPGQVLDDGPINTGWYVKQGASGTGSWVLRSRATIPALDQRTTTLSTDATALRDVAKGGSIGTYRAQTMSYATAAGYGGLAVGIEVGTDLVAGATIDGVTLAIAPDATAVQVTAKVYLRSSTGPDQGGLPGQASDALLCSVTYTLAQLGLRADATLQRALIPLPQRIAAAAGVTYVVQLECLDAGAARVAMGFGVGPATGQPTRRRGWYRPTTSAAYQGIGGTDLGVAWAVFAAAAMSLPATATKADAALQALDWRSSSTAVRLAAQSGFQASLGFGSWSAAAAAGSDIAAGSRITYVARSIEIIGGTATLRMRLWRRSVDAASLGAAPGAGSDTLLDTVTVPAGGGYASGSFNRFVFPLARPVLIEPGYYYIQEIDALSAAGGLLPYGVLRGTPSLSEVPRRGWYRTISTGVVSQVGAGNAFGWEIGTDTYAPKLRDVSMLDRVERLASSAAGGVVTIDPLLSSLDRGGQSLPIGGSVALAATTGGSVTGEARTIAAGTTGATGIVPSTARLDHANVTVTQVRDASTSAVLVAGTDYLVDAENGTLYRPVGQPTLDVVVNYTWSARRYDLVCLDPETGALSVVQGTERTRDAQEYLPLASAYNQLPLLSCRVVGTAIELIPVWDVEGGVRRHYAAALEREMRRGRKYIRKTLRKLRSGAPVTIAAYGDSIVALPGISAPTTPNGNTRDLPGYFFGHIGSDLAAALPLYDHGDGDGAIHVHASQMWHCIAALQEAYTSTITYLNFGRGGSSSGSSATNGLDPARLSALTSSAADVVIVHFGMNEISADTTGANVAAIVAAIKAAGKDAVVLGCPRPNPAYTLSKSGWLKTNRILARVAAAAGAAFVDYSSLYADEHLGVLGMSAKDVSASNAANHPAIYEHKAMGERLAKLFLYE